MDSWIKLTHTGIRMVACNTAMDIALDPLHTNAKTAAVAGLCRRLTTTETRHPGILASRHPGADLRLKYAIK
ncbi:hypothetical protein [Arthrobacter sp. H35-D1]|uniref:hypothetical protein n=1 Tax=Arthrobacter sp. H35-D1 TaxID=3046202 RepID=UPI0024B8EB34|nr:hypothetical protein [Arthrobacter sp. H35-D1]MDJ0314784.1 hypothetical protein [Arthrobacter sp. H35-D1]